MKIRSAGPALLALGSLHFKVEQPTCSVAITFDCTSCDISKLNVLDQIASPNKAQIAYGFDNVLEKSVAVSFDGWVFPAPAPPSSGQWNRFSRMPYRENPSQSD